MRINIKINEHIYRPIILVMATPKHVMNLEFFSNRNGFFWNFCYRDISRALKNGYN